MEVTKNNRRYRTALVWAALIITLLAQTNHALAESRFRQLTMADGLSNARVFSVLQDHHGYIWLATEDGLDLYDGYSIKVFKNDPSDPSTISSNLVRAVYQDPKHHLWIGTTGGGLNLYNPDKNRFRHFLHRSNDPSSISSNNISSIAGTSDGKLLLGTYDSGLDIFDPETGKSRHYQAASGIRGPSSNRINVILHDKQQLYWIGTQAGLDLFDANTGTFIHYYNKSHSSEIVRGLSTDHRGRLWIASNIGLQYLLPENKIIEQLHDQNGLSDALNLSSVLVDKNDNLWAGSVDSGLYLKQAGAPGYLRFHQNTGDLTSLSSDALWDIYMDTSGLIWVTTDNGVDILDPSMEDTLFIRPLLIRAHGSRTSNHIGAVFSNGDSLWFSSTAGIYSIPANSPNDNNSAAAKFLSAINPSLYRIVTCFLRLNKNTVLAATATGWVLSLNNEGQILKRWKIGQDIYISDPLIFGLLKINSHSVFAATYGNGLLEYNLSDGKTTQISGTSPANLTSKAKMLEVIKTRNNNLFVTTTNGLFYVDAVGRHSKSVLLNLHGAQPEPISLYQDQAHHLWVGTIRGLWKLTLDAKDEVLARKFYPIADNSISGIEPDNFGNLWLAGDNSIIRFDPDTGSIRSIGEQQNLPVSGFYADAHAHTRNGWIWFGGPDGLIGLDPKTIKINSIAPRVAISGVSLSRNDHTEIFRPNSHNTLILDYRDSLITFKLAVLNYGHPRSNSFSYRLIGAHASWTPPSFAHQIIFPSLDPGHYRLEVRGADNWGVWSKRPAVLNIDVLPPWWQTWWAYSLYAFLILGVMLFYVHSQQRKLHKEREISARLRDADAIKSNFVHELESQINKATADLKNSLESVNLKNQELEIAHRRASEGEQIKSQFLANMSHELRTPLTAILGYLKLVQQAGGTHEQADYLRTAQHSAESLLAIINDTLDLSRIESGKLLIDEVDFDLLELVENTVELLGPSAFAKRLRLVRIIPPEIPLQLRGDPLRIRQILTNLVGNAIKFTQSGSVCIRIQELDRRGRDITLGIAVSDTGIGIAAAAVKHLFEAYSRNESHPGNEIEGTGLGLSICKKLLDLMGGDIEVLSIPGVGSTFEFRLSFRTQKLPVSRPTLAPRPRIGLFDPHPLSHQAWQASLSRLGCDVIGIREIRGVADHDIDALIAVPALEEVERTQETSLEMGSIAIPHMVLAPTAEAKILERVSDACRCRVRTTLIRESQLLPEIQTLIPAPVGSKSVLPGTATPTYDLAEKVDVDHHRPLILVADDNAINRKLLVKILLQNQFRVLEAANGEELIALAAKESWDAALVDIHMPDMDGMEATQKLLALNPSVHPPVIAVSADALPETRASAQAAGMTDYLVKPYSEEQLLDVLRRNLRAGLREFGNVE